MIYAPIIIITLNRYECLKNCIESLQRNSWATKTEVYISVDYPPTDKYFDGYNLIKNYLENGVDGFENVRIYFQKKNYGSIRNAEWIRTVVEKKYDRYIFLEDDNELAPGFIEFCDKGLELFENDDSVYAINATDYVWCGNGYVPPVRCLKNNENNIEKRQLIFHATAYWRKKRNSVIEFCAEIGKKNGLCDIKNLIKLHKKSVCYFYQFLAMVSLQKKKLPWYDNMLKPIDFMTDIYMMMYDKYVICPVEPLQMDRGVDGNGINYKQVFINAEELKRRKLNNAFGFEYKIFYPIVENDYEVKLHDNNMSLSIVDKTKIWIKFIFKIIKEGINVN
jgi:hypothetical protein